MVVLFVSYILCHTHVVLYSVIQNFAWCKVSYLEWHKVSYSWNLESWVISVFFFDFGNVFGDIHPLVLAQKWRESWGRSGASLRNLEALVGTLYPSKKIIPGTSSRYGLITPWFFILWLASGCMRAQCGHNSEPSLDSKVPYERYGYPLSIGTL